MRTWRDNKQTSQLGPSKNRPGPANGYPGSLGLIGWKVGLSPPGSTMNIVPYNVGHMGTHQNNILFFIDRMDMIVKPFTLPTLTLVHNMLKQPGNIMEVSQATRTSRGELGHNPKHMPILLVNNPPMKPQSLKCLKDSATINTPMFNIRIHG